MGKGLSIVIAGITSPGRRSHGFSETEPEANREFVVPEANQGVGVDDKYFYAVDNRTIAKYIRNRKAGQEVAGRKKGPIIHSTARC